MYDIIREKYSGTKVTDICIIRNVAKDDIKLYAIIWIGVDYVFKQSMPDCIVMAVRQPVWRDSKNYESYVRDFYDTLNIVLGGGLSEDVYDDILENFSKQKIGNLTVRDYFNS